MQRWAGRSPLSSGIERGWDADRGFEGLSDNLLLKLGSSWQRSTQALDVAHLASHESWGRTSLPQRGSLVDSVNDGLGVGSFFVSVDVEVNSNADQGGSISMGSLEGGSVLSRRSNRWDIDGVVKLDVSSLLWALEVRGESADISSLLDQSDSVKSNIKLEVSSREVLGEDSSGSDGDILSRNWRVWGDVQSLRGQITSSAGCEWDSSVDWKLVDNSGSKSIDGDIERDAEGRGVVSVGNRQDNGVISRWGNGRNSQRLGDDSRSSSNWALEV